MKLPAMNIRVRMMLATMVPILVSLAFAAAYCFGKWEEARFMSRTEAAMQFADEASRLVHHLQRERGRSAGFVGNSTSASARKSLEDQQAETDAELASFYRLDAVGEAARKHLAEAKSLLSGLEAHRARVLSAQTTLSETVGPYTAAINSLLDTVATLAGEAGGGEDGSAMAGLLALMAAKEQAGLERAVGSNALAQPEIPQQLRDMVQLRYGAQMESLTIFRSLMGEAWSEKLDEVESGADAQAVSAVRSYIVSGAAAGGQSARAYTSSEWFEISTRRIDDLMELEANLTEALNSKAGLHRANSHTHLVLAITAACVFAAISISVTLWLVGGIVTPLRHISSQLERLASGDTKVTIQGAGRRDEIGVICRAAEAFRKSVQQREEMAAAAAAGERAALVERRKVLSAMAEEVESATRGSVSTVADAADLLRERAGSMSASLEAASAEARIVNTSANEALDSTARAADLAEQLNAAIAEVTENITRGNTLAHTTVQTASESRARVEELNSAAAQIEEFVTIITELASQTNLLALNATIESARAGEAGRGFAVVASEIKLLADQTNRSADQIADRVRQIQSRTQGATSAMGQIAASIESLGEVTSAVAAAMEEQRASTRSFTEFLGRNRDTITGVARQVGDLADVARQSATAAVDIRDRVNQMAGSAQSATQAIPEIVQKALAAADQRREPRYEAAGTATVSGAGAERRVDLLDVSSRGARISPAVPNATSLRFDATRDARETKVVWSSENESGLSFSEAIPQTSVARLSARKTDAA